MSGRDHVLEILTLLDVALEDVVEDALIAGSARGSAAGVDAARGI